MCTRVFMFVCICLETRGQHSLSSSITLPPAYFLTGSLTDAGTSLPVRLQDLSLPLFDALPTRVPLRPALGSHTEVSGHTQVLNRVLTLVQQASSHPLSGLNLLLLFLFIIFLLISSQNFLQCILTKFTPNSSL